MGLTEKTCVPCQGGLLPLDEKEARKMLAEVPGWNLSADATTIYRDYTFSNFKKALKFVNQVGEVAEAEQHHPDLKLGWGYVHISLQTHAIKGLHENDFILAAKINAIA